jgi:diaminopimelate epimerase
MTMWTTHQFYKYHAIGNDYIVIDPRHFTPALTEGQIRRLCDRHHGVGSDGVLLGPITDGDGYRVRIFNPDGSEAEKSGNGIRIFSRYLFDRGYVTSDNFRLQTAGGVVTVSRLDKNASVIEVDMGVPVMGGGVLDAAAADSAAVEMAIHGVLVTGHVVSMGNPHCVVFVDDPAEALARSWGPIIETHSLFPNRTNVQLVRVDGPHQLSIAIWERGAGYTLGSGSSSCAAVAVALARGMVTSPVTVTMPGGVLTIRLSDRGSLLMSGPVTPVSYGYLSPDMMLGYD